MEEDGWCNFLADGGRLDKLSALRWALILERLASLSPGLAIIVLAHVDLGTTALWLFGSDGLKGKYGARAVRGEILLCLGNTESHAGSDVAGISARAEKEFEAADLHARMESARLSLWKARWAMDSGQDFRMESSIAKYLCVKTAREVTAWAADLLGAESVMFEHPIHKYPMDAWAASLGEGTQDVQKLLIFRELMKRFE
jgi:alkylation response protein AidB-like acyl-CoA dehydrogenase